MNFPSTLKVGVVPSTIFFEINNSSIGHQPRILGVESEMLNILSKTLNFEYDLVIAEDKEWGQEGPDGNWTGLIGKVTRGDVDMAISNIVMTRHRAEAADFSTFYTLEESTFIIGKHQHTGRESLAYLYPFEFPVWLCIFITLAIFTCLFYRFSNNKSTLGQIILRLFSSLLRQPFKMSFSSNKEKLLVLTWLFFALVVSLCYSATLLSFLTIPLQPPVVQNFVELSKAVEKGTHKCYLWSNGSTIQFLTESKEDHLRSIGNAIVRNKWYLSATNDEFKFGTYIKHNSCVLRSRNILRMFHSVPYLKSKFLIARDGLGVWPVAIALKRDFCCKKKLDSIISRLRSSGIYPKLLNDNAVNMWNKNLNNNVEDEDQENSTTLKKKDIYGPLILLIIGHSSSAIVFLGEIVYFRWRDKIKNHVGLK